MTQVARYHPALVTLHWLLALLIIAALGVGFLVLADMPNTDPRKIDILRIHMAVGMAILVLMVIRLAVRWCTARPDHATTRVAALDRLAPLTHYGFYVLVILMVGSGFATSFLAGLPAIVFGHSGAPLPPDFDAYASFVVHSTIASLLTALVALHVAAALYHQFGLKDGLFRRMAFGNRHIDR